MGMRDYATLTVKNQKVLLEALRLSSVRGAKTLHKRLATELETIVPCTLYVYGPEEEELVDLDDEDYA